MYGERQAISFLDRRLNVTFSASYKTLVADASLLAHHLKTLVQEGSVALVFPQNYDFVKTLLGVLLADLTAVPVAPPKKNDRQSFFRILSASGAKIILSSGRLGNELRSLVEEFSDGALEVYLVDEEFSSSMFSGILTPDEKSSALIQFTSGSTSSPKGVCIRYDNLDDNVDRICRAYQLGTDDITISWLPFYHDMGLVGHIIVPLVVGMHTYYLSPFSFAAQPGLWLQAISKYGGTVSGAPNFAYEHCVRRVDEEQKQKLDLRSWRVAYCGAERIDARTLDLFSETYSSYGFDRRNIHCCYGLAESTLFVSAAHGLRKQGIDGGKEIYVSVGRVSSEEVIIVSEQSGEPMHECRVGEICIRSASLASGYFRNLRESGDVDDFVDSRGFFHTGDRGFIKFGELFIVGRKDHVAVIKGQNYYPEDVEYLAREILHERGVSNFVALCLEDDNSSLSLVAESSNLPPKEEKHIQSLTLEHIRQFGIPLSKFVWVQKGTLSYTTSGKPRRDICRARLGEL